MSFLKISELLTLCSILNFLEEGMASTLRFYAFKVGLGGVSIQKGKVISYAARQ